MNETLVTWAENSPDWLTGSGESANIVIATSASLRRNLAGFQFPVQASTSELGTILAEIRSQLTRQSIFQGGVFFDLEELEAPDLKILGEMLLVPRPGSRGPSKTALLVCPDRQLSALLNGDDHLQLNTFRPGFDPGSAQEGVLDLETSLEASLGFAYRDELGYLTASAGSVGTGLHLSALVHLPGLVLAGEIGKIFNALRQLRFSIGGLNSGRGAARGHLFRITSQATLGRDEGEILRDFQFHLERIIGHEQSARDLLQSRDSIWLEDRVFRSRSILESARLITTQESFDRLSDYRLGVGLGILPNFDLGKLNSLLFGLQSAHLDYSSGKTLSSTQRQASRASFLRNRLGSLEF